ncbi:MAG TPA: hypothetical protein DEB56_10250 [Thiobacillus sp.]|nr:hypothetical protein [Thiobacillus sp.]
MAKRNGSTPQDHHQGMAMLNYFESLTPDEKQVYIAECEPHLAAALRKWLVDRPTSGNRAKEIKPKPAKELIVLDFKPYDILDDLDRLRAMVEAGEISGLVFAAKYTKPGERRHFFGASGRYAENIDEALGATAMLQRDLMRM